jgi:acyl-CoA reductase-like NAD-dependent aldehyde dehydrogenase
VLGSWRKGEASDVRRALKQARRRQAWMRRLPPRELERIVATVESDLEAFPTKDSLLEHLARLHFDARAR